MHIEISDRDARHAMHFLRMARGNRGIGKKAEPHGPRGLSVMARWARGAKSVSDRPGANRIHRGHRRASAPQGSLNTAMGHDGIGIQSHAITLGGSRL